MLTALVIAAMLVAGAQAQSAFNNDCVGCVKAGHDYCLANSGEQNSGCHATGTFSTCNLVDVDGNRDQLIAAGSRPSLCLGGCTNFAESCSDCSGSAPANALCGWCHTTGNCIDFTEAAGGGVGTVSCDAQQFTVGTCELPCPSRLGCNNCLRGVDCVFDNDGDQCYDAADSSAPAGAFTEGSQCPDAGNSASSTAAALGTAGACAAAAALA